jgi:hypothetical protein
LSLELRAGEIELIKKAANLFRGRESVGGKIIITNQRIYFKPHFFNVQKDYVEIPMEEIVEVQKRNTLGFVPNGMKVSTRNGEEYKFVVRDREKLIDLIKDLIKD